MNEFYVFDPSYIKKVFFARTICNYTRSTYREQIKQTQTPLFWGSTLLYADWLNGVNYEKVQNRHQETFQFTLLAKLTFYLDVLNNHIHNSNK